MPMRVQANQGPQSSVDSAPSHATYLVDQNRTSWNRVTSWLRHLDQLQLGA